MAIITGLTAERMREIEAASIVDGHIDVAGHLILTRYDGGQIDAGDATLAIPADKLVTKLDVAGYSETTPPTSYPSGMSYAILPQAETTADWPTFAGTVGLLTNSGNSWDNTQTWRKLGGSGSVPELWLRQGNGTSGWGPWKKVSLKDDVDAVSTRLTTIENANLNTRVSTLESATTLGDNALLETAAASSYPFGYSLMNVSTGSGWSLNSESGLIVTFRKSDTRTTQWFHRTSGANDVWIRNHHTSNPGWTAWSKLSFDKPPYVIQAGNGTVPSATLTVCGYAASALASQPGYVRGTSRITLPSAGTYEVCYRYKLNTTVGSGRAFVELTLGALTEYQYTITADTTTFARMPIGEGEDLGTIVGLVSVKAGASIGINAFQSFGAPRSIDGVLHIRNVST